MYHPENEFDESDFEWHEGYSELIEKNDYEGLIKFCLKRVMKDPDDVYGISFLGDAYVLNGNYQKAIDYIVPHLTEMPDNLDFQWVILDALYKSGKTETDFDWIINPDVIKLDSDTLDHLFSYLKNKRKPRSVFELIQCFGLTAYTLFSEAELTQALKNDGRFEIDNHGGFLAKKKKGPLKNKLSL
jgi:hypothetical protein